MSIQTFPARWKTGLGLLFSALCTPMLAQDEQLFTLSVQAQVVTVAVTVRDSKGHLIDNLTKGDFTLIEDGQPQRIRYLSADRDRPLRSAC